MKTKKSNQNRAWLYFAMTFGWSWLFLVPAIVLGLDTDQPLTTWLRALSGIGPAMGALFLLYTTGSPQSRREYWQRLTSFRQVKTPWWIVILFTPLVLTLMSGGLDALQGGKGLQLESSLPGAASPLAWLGFVAFILIFGPIPEEMGWREVALDALQDGWGALSSSLILGLAWALWHLPLFFIEGTYQADLGILSAEFWNYLLLMIPTSVLMTWVYNNTHRSILSAVIFHFTINLTGEIIFASPTGNWINFGLWILASGIVIWITDPGTLQRKLAADNVRKKGRI